MCKSKPYTLELPEGAWRHLPEAPSQELATRARTVLEQIATQVPRCPAQGGEARSVQLGGGYVALVGIVYAQCRITLLEVTRTR